MHPKEKTVGKEQAKSEHIVLHITLRSPDPCDAVGSRKSVL